jgi:hypothetical protein
MTFQEGFNETDPPCPLKFKRSKDQRSVARDPARTLYPPSVLSSLLKSARAVCATRQIVDIVGQSPKYFLDYLLL